MNALSRQGTGLDGVMQADYSHSSQALTVSYLDISLVAILYLKKNLYHVINSKTLSSVPVAHDLEWRAAFSGASSHMWHSTTSLLPVIILRSIFKQ